MFIVLIIMARFLGPELFGLVAMVMIFIDVAQGIVDFGFSQALIRRINSSQQERDTILLFNLIVASAIYLTVTLCSGAIADFFHQPLLSQIIPWLGLAILFDSTCVVQRSLLSASINFKVQARASLIASAVGGSVGLILTFFQKGVIALVALYVVRSFVNALLLWVWGGWRPTFRFSLVSIRDMAAFSSPLAIAGLLDSLYTNGINLMIGREFNAKELAFFGRARQFASLPSSNLTNVIQKVSYPALCQMSDDRERLSLNYRRFLILSTALIFPVMLMMTALANPVIRVLLGDEWLFSARLLMILAPTMMWYPVHAINLNLLLVEGRSNLFLKVEILKKITGIALILIFFPMGIEYVALAMLISTLIALVYNTHYTRVLIGLGLLRQLRDFLPILLLSLLSGGICLVFTLFHLPDMLILLIAIPVGILVYLGGIYYFQPKVWKEFISMKSLF